MTSTLSTPLDGWLDAAGRAVVNTLTIGETLQPGPIVRGAQDLSLPTAVLVGFGGAVNGEFALFIDATVAEALQSATIGSLDVGAALAPTLQAIAQALGTNPIGDPQTVDGPTAMRQIATHGEHGVITFNGANGVRAAVAIGGEQMVAAATGGTPIDRFDLLRGVEMQASVELGRARLTVDELLSLRSGEVIELDRAAGEPADLFVNGRLIAHGEIVVVGENYGLRVTELVTDDASRQR